MAPDVRFNLSERMAGNTFVVVGWPVLDELWMLPHLPGITGYVPGNQQRTVGGSAANVATNLHRMGRPARLVGVAGNDEAGDEILKKLDREGLPYKVVRNGYTPTVLCLIPEDDGEPRRISNLDKIVSLGMGDIDDSWTEDCAALHFEPWQIGDSVTRRAWAALSSQAQLQGAPISIELPQPHLIEDIGRDALKGYVKGLGVDFVFANEHEADAAGLHENPQEWARFVVVHRSDDSTVYYVEGERHEAPLDRSVGAVDATGAGDAFTSGVLAAYVAGSTLAEAIQAGHAAGLAAVLTPGATLRQSDAVEVYAGYRPRGQEADRFVADIERGLDRGDPGNKEITTTGCEGGVSM